MFSTPVREVFALHDYPTANHRHKELTGKGFSKQAFAIFPPIRQLDQFLIANAAACKRVFEVHPEVCFWAANGKVPLQHPKKSDEGIEQRRGILSDALEFNPFSSLRLQFLDRDVADDDIVDALIALWTAERISRGTANTFPETPESDRYGLLAAIWY